MKSLRQVFLGIVIALASISLLLGGFSLSLAEGGIVTNSSSTPSSTPSSIPTSTSTLTSTHALTATSSPTWPSSSTPLADSPTPTSTPSLTLTPTLPAPPVHCPPPFGWLPYVVPSDYTLEKIATQYRVSIAELQRANCLLTTAVLPGVFIYVPPVPTWTPLPCGRPNNWIAYIIQPGDTLYHLGQVYNVSVAELQRANCMGSSTLLHVGRILYVPPGVTRAPASIPIAPVASTSIPTDTLIPAAADTPVEVSAVTPMPNVI